MNAISVYEVEKSYGMLLTYTDKRKFTKRDFP
jgi:hypothetical protein